MPQKFDIHFIQQDLGLPKEQESSHFIRWVKKVTTFVEYHTEKS